ncbi:MAG: phosphoglucosamine mutase, partial [Candidatus Aminicenantes bacterium]|nr:phosphoglucosamine mutase [Candidatus Aminicenantes bacterium]
EVPRYFMIKDRIDKTQEETYRLIKEMRKKYTDKGEISLMDGMKITFSDYWVHIRPSNTEPIIRLIVEAKSRARAEEMVGFWRREIAEISKWK